MNRRPLLLTGLLWLGPGCSLIDSTAGLTGGSPETALPADDGGAAPKGGSNTDSASPASSQNDPTDASSGAIPGADAASPPAAASDASVSSGASPDAASTAPTAPTAIYSSLSAPLGIAVSAGKLCWAGGAALRSISCGPATGGGAAEIETIAAQTTDPLVAGAFDVALDSESIYWSNGPTVIRKPWSGGASASFFNGLRLAYLAAQGDPSDGGTQIWASDYSPPDSGAAGADILFGPIDPATSEYLYEGEPGASGVAVYEDTVFWGTATSEGYIGYGPKVGKAARKTIAAGGPVTGLAIDAAGTLYFLVSDQYVYRLPSAGGSPALVYDAGEAIGGGDVAVDDDAVYLSEHDAGRIMRLPK